MEYGPNQGPNNPLIDERPKLPPISLRAYIATAALQVIDQHGNPQTVMCPPTQVDSEMAAHEAIARAVSSEERN